MKSPLRREALQFLSSRAGPLPPAVRSVLFGLERFHQHGVSLAQAQPVERRRAWRRRVRTPPFFPRLEANGRVLQRTRGYLESLDREGESLSPAAEWLLDNFHLIEAQLPEVRSGMPRGYYAELPKLRQAPLAGLPRVYGIAWAFVAHTDSSFDPGLLACFLQGYQEVDVLTLGELWALPSTLRVVLMENLARLADSVATTKAALEAATWCCDRGARLKLERLDELYDLAARRGVGPVFLAQMVQRRRIVGLGDGTPWLAWLQTKVSDADALLAESQAAQAADNVSVSNAVTALRKISHLEWMGLINSASPVLRSLGQVPAFAADSEFTRDATTHEIERLARRLRRTELEVAQRVVELCAAPGTPAHVGPAHWTIGEGRESLLAALGAGPAAMKRSPVMLWRRWRTSLYAGLLCAGGGGLLAWLATSRGASGWMAGVALLLMAFPALECVIALVHRMLAEAVRVQRLPRLALENGLQPEHATLVAVPCMLGSPAGVGGLLERLELHHLANPEAHVRFALVSDWLDAPAATQPGDEALLSLAREGVTRLNARYPWAGPGARFLLLHRQRQWCEGEGVWMGWERKRGKLEQLLQALAEGGLPSPFLDLGELSRLPDGVRYAVVLDSDTELPPASLREMVAIAAHPLNQPRIDDASRRVVAGYGILQPHVVSRFPAAGEATAFGWIFAGPWGTDAYNGGCSEIYQDVFDEGSFYGKGLFDVRAVHEVLRGRVTPGRLLSHDLFEGLWARCAYLSDVVVLESHPMHPDVAASRTHRWTRGDWQLLAFMGAVVTGGVGGLNVWKVLDNLRRSLLAPACVALLWWSFVTGTVAPLVAVTLVLAAHALGPLIGALAGFSPSRWHVAWRHLLAGAGRDLARSVSAALWQTATLLHTALLHLDAIARACWRMVVSRQGLLEWTTADQAHAAARHDWPGFWKRHARTSLLAVVWMASGLLLPGAAHGWLWGFGLLWLCTPGLLWWGARPLQKVHTSTLDAARRDYLMGVARDTWRYFERHVGAEDNHLPPDNLQVEPRTMLAHRTSPTNIGLYLLSALCAHRLGFIDSVELGRRIDLTLAALERLERHRGHLFNWIDTISLATLMPKYVSTVDSGNLAACLWALAQACRDIARSTTEDAANAADWLERARRADAEVAGMDFGFLYDRRRRLLHIGYRLDDAALDPAYYDLLASEARLTSFVAIAKGDLPRRHWEALGRPFLAFQGAPALRSWSGSMFEYLMPSLLMEEPADGLLRRMAAVAVRAHRRFGRQHDMPWGVSECAYFAQDHTLAFQYSPFGVSSLALRRTPVEDRVIAPYATALAAMVDASAAVGNLQRIEALGGRGEFGFIEALDFTRIRGGQADDPLRVAAFMAHHQGMSLVALANVLCDGVARAWFGRAAPVAAHASLLHERMAREILLQEPLLPRAPHGALGVEEVATVREFDFTEPPAWLPTQWLSNGRYGVSLRPNGAGSSSWRGRAISRSRDDALRDRYGTWLMVRLDGEPGLHSLTAAPCPRPHTRYRARFFNDHVEFLAECDAFEAQLSVWVSADDDIEFRHLTLHNLRDEPLALELMSFFELALTTQAADEAHPAFSNLFVQAHAMDPRGLLLERRPRLQGEPGVWAAHFLGACDLEPERVQLCCNREQMLPRRGGMASLRPACSEPAPGGRLDTGLDPAASITLNFRLPPRARMSTTFATAAADDSDKLLALMDEYRQEVHLQSARTMAAALARIRHRELGVNAADLHAAQDLASLMVMSHGRQRDAPALAVDRRVLWRFGISGERPMVLVHVNALHGLGAIRALIAAQRLWEMGGLATDLVILDGEQASYLMPLQSQLTSLRSSLGGGQHEQPERGSVQLLRESEVSPAELCALQACARVELVADGRSLSRLLAQSLWKDVAGVLEPTRPPATPPAPQAWAPNRFDGDGRGFTIDLDDAHVTPRPWANVLANPQFGCIVTESGGGFTWALNSRMNQLTPWSNDALLDPIGEHYLVRDVDDGSVFGLLPGAERNGARGWTVRHTQGASEFVHQRGDLHVTATICVDPHESVKCLRVRLRHRSPRPRRLQLVACVEWVVGSHRRERMSLATEYLGEFQAVLARQLEHQGGFGEGTAFLALRGARVSHWTCARDEFFGADGGFRLPDEPAGAAGFGIDPCAALQAPFELAAGDTFEACWLLGFAPGREAALALLRRLQADGVAESMPERALAAWDERLAKIEVRTPDPLFDAMVNRWWPYQAVACRLWARAAFYQAGGAFGYRDQLQDAMALAWTDPGMLREQILLHAGRQFAEGDVQHWWHMPTGAGVRTRFSDDLLWLPYAIQHYLECTGDHGLLDEERPFIEGPQVPPDAEDAYYVPVIGGQTASVYEHAARAIDHALRFGAHGLPLMGTGDWNDGMNRVGHEGRGESVWLGWFVLAIVPRWQQLAAERQDNARAGGWAAQRETLEQAMQAQAWDGRWYRRAFFDNGHPLGSRTNAECSIDLIAQAWSVLTGALEQERARQAMASADEILVDRSGGLVRLLHPPLQQSADHAGYIQAYPPGVRENGGQYAHAGAWALLAQARLGHADKAWEYFCMLSPAHRAGTPAQQRRYRLEPYVMPGDVYSAPPYEGRGGWSWYTGSAAWMWRAALEGLLGLSLRPGAVRLRPCLPVHWPHARVTLRLGGRELQVLLQRAELPVPRDSIPVAVDQWIDTTGLADGSVLCAVLAPSTAAQAPSPVTEVHPGPDAG
ncbi:MAG TPA: glucoamylase family protein [Ideonella sp.]|uniref:GH36-type glycosyl hydrolase domain-containing protein n=1 Tax=Ideonella sp. TaxID=1929293 RepID=UPI002E300CD6|nr:glucoamylase family protein [Ideonella sp.]HEX5685111.1 glucoamylase family protein [Ideonella sp.]